MAVTALDSPQRRKDAPGEDKAGEFALLLVQEWLVACKLESTARCLVDECARAERNVPARVVWNQMVENLGFGPRSPATGGKRGGGNTTLLEAVVRRAVEHHEKGIAQATRNHALVPHQQVVVMSKKRELRFVAKRSLPRSKSAAPSSSNNNAQDRSPEVSSPPSSHGLRPKSAMVCKSTSELVSKGLVGDSIRNSSSRSSLSSDVDLAAKKALGTNQRPISAAGVMTPHRDSLGRKSLQVQAELLRCAHPRQAKPSMA